jgi:hypothetical protein
MQKPKKLKNLKSNEKSKSGKNRFCYKGAKGSEKEDGPSRF